MKKGNLGLIGVLIFSFAKCITIMLSIALSVLFICAAKGGDKPRILANFILPDRFHFQTSDEFDNATRMEIGMNILKSMGEKGFVRLYDKRICAVSIEKHFKDDPFQYLLKISDSPFKPPWTESSGTFAQKIEGFASFSGCGSTIHLYLNQK